MWNFYTVLLQIHSGNCLQKIDILDLSLIKLLQNEQGCIFLPHSVESNTKLIERPIPEISSFEIPEMLNFMTSLLTSWGP